MHRQNLQGCIKTSVRRCAEFAIRLPIYIGPILRDRQADGGKAGLMAPITYAKCKGIYRQPGTTQRHQSTTRSATSGTTSCVCAAFVAPPNASMGSTPQAGWGDANTSIPTTIASPEKTNRPSTNSGSSSSRKERSVDHDCPQQRPPGSPNVARPTSRGVTSVSRTGLRSDLSNTGRAFRPPTIARRPEIPVLPVLRF